MVKAKPGVSWKPNFITIGVIAVGMLLGAIQLVYNASSYMQAMFIKVEHPATYRFTTLDHLLKDHVKGMLVDYASLRKDAGRLNQAVEELKRISPDRMTDPNERLCFWINAHNLLVLKSIVDHYPVKSVKPISNMFCLNQFIVGGTPCSVDQIDRGEIRPLLRGTDILALFTECGGARGYPPLINHALEPSRLNEDSLLSASEFVNNSNNVFYDPDTATLFVSPFLKWNEHLLAGVYKSPFDFANAFLTPDRQVDLKEAHTKTAFFYNFDWRLDDTALGPVQQLAPSGEREESSSDGPPDVPAPQVNR